MDYYEELIERVRNESFYKFAPKPCIGGSDRASLFAIGFDSDYAWKFIPIHFGSDGSYRAYICTEKAEIGAHYHLVGQLHHEIRIIDDDDGACTFEATADEINLWRAGEFGLVIQLCGLKEIEKALW